MGRVSGKLSPDAVVRVKASLLVPAAPFRASLGDQYTTKRYEDVRVVAQAMKDVKGKIMAAVTLSHPEFPAGEVWALAANIKLVKAGPAPYFQFGSEPAPAPGTSTVCLECRDVRVVYIPLFSMVRVIFCFPQHAACFVWRPTPPRRHWLLRRACIRCIRCVLSENMHILMVSSTNPRVYRDAGGRQRGRPRKCVRSRRGL